MSLRLNDTPSPRVVGFDMPDACAGQGDAPSQILSVQLDGQPSAAWTSECSSKLARFQQHHGLADVRVVGDRINVVGARVKIRSLTRELRLLVETVERDLILQRVNGRRAQLVEPATDPVQRWIDDELAQQHPHFSDVLEDVRALTMMRFGAISKIDDAHWTALALRDELAFGMQPNQRLNLEVTICGEVRFARAPIAFGRASEDPKFSSSPLPSMYGFESYISIPIFTPQGDLFGTLCALDRESRLVTPDIIGRMEEHAAHLALNLFPTNCASFQNQSP